MGTSKKQKKREWLRYRDFVLSPYGVIKIKSLGYIQSETEAIPVSSWVLTGLARNIFTPSQMRYAAPISLIMLNSHCDC
ncbi:hypothetical protein [Symbiopectobacterium sp. RP]|uniref:hypothetical protein n=1 Tax=Symbiopectobacterium sp. RP TaxID=3248553 RepID=UPI003D2680C8